jgi:hypothetical protein
MVAFAIAAALFRSLIAYNGVDKCISGAWFRSTDLWVMSPTR